MNPPDLSKEPTLFGHPKGLFYLFFAELWERFSFYGMRALLILYMTSELLYSDTMSFGIYAAYGSLVYATPLIGGMLADKILGYRKSIMLGGILMAMGHFLLSFEHPLFFYLSLGLLVVGNGFFKPNISSFVGALYKKNDPRRDAGFTIFYLGINIGGMVAPLLCAWVAAAFGWHYGFSLAGIGMVVGLAFFFKGMRDDVFGEKGGVPEQRLFDKRTLGMNQGNFITLLAVIAVPVFAFLIRNYEYEHYLIWLVFVGVIGAIAYMMSTVKKAERHRLLVVAYFTFLATLFWAVFEQGGSSVTLFASRNVNLIGINAAQTNSINSGFIILLAIPFSLLWSFLAGKRFNPGSAAKFGIGLILLGLGFLAFSLSAHQADAMAQTPMLYLFIGYFILTVGEMFLSPIGLSKMTELSPVKFLSFIMGVWFLSSFFGHFFAGKIAQLTTIGEGEAGIFSSGALGDFMGTLTGMPYQKAMELGEPFQQLHSYVSTFAGFGCMVMVVGVGVVLLSPLVKKLMHGVH
ncbi:oligopeptide:H+ symporter [bacterium]|nr:oligopeptide:H+ symporter [bacterium]